MTGQTVLVTGGTGFVGARVTALLADRSGQAEPAARVRLLLHRTGHQPTRQAEVEPAHADLARPESLRGICDGVHTVLHLASQIGGDPELCRAVNDEGTRALLAEARRAGVTRIIQLSTTAVYRDSPHRGAHEEGLPYGPASVTSASRLAGEARVRAAGGVVLRPHLVYGTGDTWVVPALAELLTALPYWVEGGRARTSLTRVDDLARAITGLARARMLPAGRALHATHPRPVLMRDVLTDVARGLQLPPPDGDVSRRRALELLGGPENTVWRRRLGLLTVDHWYDSSRLWRLLGLSPGPEFSDGFAGCLPWYRAALAPQR
ncbi:NAD(P)-dependent oxidoreductase [Streptomyces sp. N2-109]|uniref:NAD(P)-dependent oxidoreductase n=1 Tax=Streptomyces gossypii TaxID=2883101 RepID=A0ABT2K530_9ACTN|nr:NAD(P)-dependent oxidoreductase [Streptomyces gossypii]MCT2594739.1 NAD(P)-dependent oxidoreductase [Streptomyces gossypii]